MTTIFDLNSAVNKTPQENAHIDLLIQGCIDQWKDAGSKEAQWLQSYNFHQSFPGYQQKLSNATHAAIVVSTLIFTLDYHISWAESLMTLEQFDYPEIQAIQCELASRSVQMNKKYFKDLGTDLSQAKLRLQMYLDYINKKI